MKVSDFDIDFDSGSLFTCCMSDVMGRQDEDAFENMIIECDECGAVRKKRWCSYVESGMSNMNGMNDKLFYALTITAAFLALSIFYVLAARL
jgi:hypothetical protein